MMISVVKPIFVSFTAIISRQLRDTHWSVLCLSSKFVSTIQLVGICIYLGVYCLPACGLLRFNIIILSLIANITQVFYIICLQNEEAHIIGLSDNASNIIVFPDFSNNLLQSDTKDAEINWMFLGSDTAGGKEDVRE